MATSSEGMAVRGLVGPWNRDHLGLKVGAVKAAGVVHQGRVALVLNLAQNIPDRLLHAKVRAPTPFQPGAKLFPLILGLIVDFTTGQNGAPSCGWEKYGQMFCVCALKMSWMRKEVR